MRAVRDLRKDLQEDFKYEKVKRDERKKSRELRDKKRTRHAMFVDVE